MSPRTVVSDLRVAEPEPVSEGGALPVKRLLLRTRLPVVQLVILAAVFAWGAVSMEGFASGPSIRATLVISSLLALAALGQTLVILVGGLDLAVPAYITVGAVSAVMLGGSDISATFRQEASISQSVSWPLWAVALFVSAVCGVAGGVCGWICHYFQVQSLVVTLGMSSVLLGAVIILTDGDIRGTPPEQLSLWTSILSTTYGIPLPPVVCLTAVLCLLVFSFLARTPSGRKLYATGANPVAAEIVLINTKWVWVITFGLGAAAAGITGMLVGGFAGGANLALGDPYFFSGLAAVLVGGTALGSANGDYFRTVIGAVTLTMLTTILVGLGLSEGDTRVLYGVAIILVVLAYGRARRLRDRL